MSSTIQTVDPATGVPIATYEAWDPDRVETAVARAHAASRAWSLVPVAERAARAARLARALREHRGPLASLVVAEMGKPVREAEGEVEKSAVTAEYYARQGPAILADERVEVDGAQAWVAYEPVGLVLAVMPWDFPVWQVMRFAIPALVAGNGVLLKHAPNVTGSALALQDLFVAAGFPEHLVTALVLADIDVPAARQPRSSRTTVSPPSPSPAATGPARRSARRRGGRRRSPFWSWEVRTPSWSSTTPMWRPPRRPR